MKKNNDSKTNGAPTYVKVIAGFLAFLMAFSVVAGVVVILVSL